MLVLAFFGYRHRRALQARLRRARAPSPCSEKPTSGLFGAPTTVYGGNGTTVYGGGTEYGGQARSPKPALAPSSAGRARAADRMRLVRGRSVAGGRFPIATEHTRKTVGALSVTIPAAVVFARAGGDSPDADARANKYSWVTPASADGDRPRFRTVNSWVSMQAAVTAAGGGAVQMPETPAEFKVHPGSAVAYGEGGRVESRVLDGLGLRL